MTLTGSTGNSTRSPATTVLTDPRGLAVFAALSAGTYFLKMEGERYKPLSFTEYVFVEGGTTKHAEISINLTGTVRGRILDARGAPLAGSRIALFSPAYIAGQPSIRLAGRREDTGRAGEFEITDVMSGEYYLQVDNSFVLSKEAFPTLPRFLYYPSAGDISSAARVVVRGHDVFLGDIQILDTSVFKISGIVSNATGRPSPTFYMARANSDRLMEPALVLARFYGVNITGLPAEAYVADIRFGNRSILNEGSFVARASDERLEVHVAAPAGGVHGVVRTAANEVVPKATVVLIPDWTRQNSSLFYRRALTDAGGQFTFSGIAPGEYQIFAFAVPPPVGAEENLAFIEPYMGRGIALRATGGITVETQIRVIQ